MPSDIEKASTGAQVSPVQFPTEAEFLEWWDNREDGWSLTQSRARSCPIARYLQAHGHREVSVDSYSYWMDENDRAYLPKWAVRFITAADLMGKPYRGLPEGYEVAL